jgi:hypothetical protein
MTSYAKGRAMSERERVAAANEAVSREVNEQIETLELGMAQVSDGNMHLVCECAILSCTERLIVPIATYEKIRNDPTLFFVKPGHEKLAMEFVVDEEADYRIVRKRPGDAEELVRRVDPRRAKASPL